MKNLKKFNINESVLDEEHLVFSIGEIIQDCTYLSDVPYSYHNEKQVDPESIEDAAKQVFEYLKNQ